MPFPAVVRSWLQALALLGFAHGAAHAQIHTGGSGDGGSQAGLSNHALSGSLPPEPYTASASGGDGYGVAGRASLALDGLTLPPVLFTGSEGDGYGAEGLHHSALDGVTSPAVLFTGADGDGHDSSGLNSLALDGSNPPGELYFAGGGDGYDVQGLLESALDQALAYGFVFSGGAGDGYDVRGAVINALDGVFPDPALYTAGNSGGDGYDFAGSAFNSLDGFVLSASAFTGGAGDGYDAAGSDFNNLAGAGNSVESYLGGAGDGYDAVRQGNVVFDPATLPSPTLFAGSRGDGYDTSPAPYILYMGDGGAGAPMTYSIWRSVNFTGAEYAAGLAADTADADFDGLSNLLEYAIGSDPHIDDAAAFGPLYRVSDLSDLGYPALPDKHLMAIVHRDPRIFDVTLAVEVSTDLHAPWDDSSLIPVGTSLPSIFIVRDSLGIETAPRRLMRLRATLDP